MPQRKEKISSPDYPQFGRKLVDVSGNDASCKPSPGLYLVATPIGHLGDITLRALTVLAHADAIACEDTRNSHILLDAFGVKKPTFSYHDHNADERRPEILNRLRHGEVVALVSDAGMPAIADPGFKLVRDCREAGLPVYVLPGANAALTALASSGLPTDRFTFAGFLPPKSIARKKAILALKTWATTLVFYETPQRLAECLADLAEGLGRQRPAAVARELTKFFEEIRRGTLDELASYYAAHEAKGEIVIVVDREILDEAESLDLEKLLSDRLKVLSVRDAVAEVAEMTGLPKKEIYAKALSLSADGAG